MEQTALGIQFNETLAALEEALQALTVALRAEQGLPAELAQGEGDARETAAQVYCAVEYDDTQSANETISCVGAIAATPSTLALAREINGLKDRLAATKKEMDKHFVEHPEKTGVSLSLYAYHLRFNLHRPRLHFVQTKRRILVLDQYPYPPKRIGLVMASSDRKIQTLSWQAVHDRLIRRHEAPAVAEALDVLASLPRDEVFAHVQDAAPHVRANIAWVHSDRSITRLQRRVSMPLLYPHKEGEKPVLTGPRLGASDRVERLDVKIEAAPLCASHRIYRYLPEYREQKKRKSEGSV